MSTKKLDDAGASAPASSASSGAGTPLRAAAARYAYSFLAYVLFVVFGCATLLPWNVLLNAIGFFKLEYPEHSGAIAFYLTAAYTYPQVPLQLLMVFYGSRVPLRLRFLVALGVQAAAMALLPVLAPASMWATLATAFVLGVTTAVFQSSLYGLASVMPIQYNQGVMFGMGLAGVSASVAQLAVRAALPGNDLGDQRAAAITYFAVASSFMLLTAGCFLALLRMPFARYHMARAAEGGTDALAAAAGGGGGGEGGGGGDGDSEHLLAAGDDGSSVEMAGLIAAAGSAGVEDALDDEAGGKHGGGAPALDASAPPLTTLALVRAVWVDAASVFIVFTLTFLIFPSVTPYGVAFKSQLGALQLSNDTWWLLLLLQMNIFDTLGRFAPGIVQLCSGRVLLAASLSRVAIVVLFIGCARNWSPVLGDAAAIVLMALFATTNGYFASLAMMQGPQVVREKDRERAGIVLAFFLQLGILVGSQLAFTLA